MRLIGLAGVSGSGKSTVAGMLAAELVDQGFSAKTDAFALPIKQRIRALKAEKGLPAVVDKTGDRIAMQKIAAAVCAADPDYYINCLAGRNTYGCVDFVIVSDVRYPAEAEFVRSHGVLIYVCGCKRPLRGAAAEDVSESHFAELFAGADYAISPQPSLEHLAAAVKALVAAGGHLRKPRAGEEGKKKWKSGLSSF